MRRFGLIGATLSHSFSKRYFEEKFKREGLDCSYSLYELQSIEQIYDLLSSTPDLCGLNVTIPYKQRVIPHLTSLSYEAQIIGAVNCIEIRDGKLTGHNTDAEGFRLSLSEMLGECGSPQIESALILGTGGASLAVQYVLSQMDIAYNLVSRDPARGNYTYDNLPCEVVAQSRLIVNASPVGTYPDSDKAPKIPYAFLSPEHLLFDLVYNPEVTTFMDYGMQRGATCKSGYQMLTLQAEAAWRIWNRE